MPAKLQAAPLLPRAFQANTARLYIRVIGPALTALPVHSQIQTGHAPDQETFLDRAVGQVDNYTANEACKVFALMLVSLFERQLRLWAPHVLEERTIKDTPGLRDLLYAIANNASLDMTTNSLRETYV